MSQSRVRKLHRAGLQRAWRNAGSGTGIALQAAVTRTGGTLQRARLVRSKVAVGPVCLTDQGRCCLHTPTITDLGQIRPPPAKASLVRPISPRQEDSPRRTRFFDLECPGCPRRRFPSRRRIDRFRSDRGEQARPDGVWTCRESVSIRTERLEVETTRTRIGDCHLALLGADDEDSGQNPRSSEEPNHLRPRHGLLRASRW